MGQVREAIESLCTIINNEIPTRVRAESFRLAKFDKVEATGTLWYTLYSLLVRDKENKIGDKNQCVAFCKHKMFNFGYRMADFFQLPEDMSCGSRELILALGWLIAKENIIEKFVNKVQVMIGEDPPVDTLISKKIPLPSGLKTETRRDFRLDAEGLGDFLVMSYGKLNSSLKSLLATSSEYSGLVSRLHSIPTTSKCQAPSHFSALDVYLLRYPNELLQYQEKLERFCSSVKAFLCWSENELRFWTWMESVLDEKISHFEHEEVPQSQDNSKQQEEPYLRPSIVLQKLKEDQVALSKYFNSQEKLYRKASKTWKKVKARLESSEEESDHLLDVLSVLDSQLLSEIRELQEHWQVSQESYKDSKGELPVCFKKLNHKGGKTSAKELETTSAVSQEITRLSDKKMVLETKLRKLQEQHKSMLLHISQARENLVCIPPDVRFMDRC